MSESSIILPNNGRAQAAIGLSNFSLTYGGVRGKEPLQALRDVNVTIEDGEFVTIVGPSGCGKTTLLRVIAGLLAEGHDNVKLGGSISIFGKSPAEAKNERMFAFTFQNPVLLPWRTVSQNVALPLELLGQSEPAVATVVEKMLAVVGIYEFSGSMASEISGGMQQRVNLARALVQEPKILLMDEPFGSLDEVTRERMNFELLRVHRLKKQTVLFVTHSLSEATLLADRVLVLSKRPGTIREHISIGLPRERSEETLLSPEYLALVRKLREVFAREEAAG